MKILLAVVLLFPFVPAIAVMLLWRAERSRPRGYALPQLLGLVVLPAALLALIPYVLPYVLPVVAAATLALAGLLGRALLAHLAPGRVRHALLALTEAGRVGSLYVEQQVAPALRGPDGSLSPDAAALAKSSAVKAALGWLGQSGLAEIKRSLALTDDQLAAQLGVAVEASVASMAPSVAPVLPVQMPTEKEIVPLAQGGAGTPRNLVRPVGP